MVFFISMISPECPFVAFFDCMASVGSRIVSISILMKMLRNVICKVLSLCLEIVCVVITLLKLIL